MKVARIPLKPHSRFHFGELKLDHDLALSDTSLFAHSDTLFSALVNAWSAYNSDAADFIKYFIAEDEGIKISSLFYYLQSGEERVYFLPKPVFLDIESPKTADGNHKKRNRVKFVSKGVWENGFEAEKWFEENNQSYHVIQNTFLLTQEEYQKLGGLQIDSIAMTILSPKSPKRATENAAIYYQADVETGGNEQLEVGFYFLYEALGIAETKLKIATNIMAYTGIGGEIKNTGRTPKGDPEFDGLDFSPMIVNPKYVCISLLNPKNESEFSLVKYYSSTLRGGRLLGKGKEGASVVRMIEEGALVESADLKGRLVPLGLDENDRTIFRNGVPFFIPVQYGS